MINGVRNPGPAVVVALLACAGCGQQNDGGPASKAPEMPGASRPSATSPDLTGTWTVVGHHMPGISAIGEEDAAARHGQVLRLMPTEAASSNDRCDAPGYSSREVRADEYLATEYKLEPGSLKPLAGREQLRLFEVSCNGTPWVGFGALLIEIGAARALTPWDGVFFELERKTGPS
ncbi:MAG: hypothetical protein ACRETY_02635 [Steroidobacteraceae bacterium]